MIDRYSGARAETPLADFDGYNLRPAQPEVAGWLQADIAAREYEEPVQSMSRQYGEMIGTLPVRDPRDVLRAKAQAAMDAWERQVGFTRALADHTVADGHIDTVLDGLADSAWNLVWASESYNVLGPDAGKARDVLVREAGRVDDIQHGRRMTNQEHLDALLEDFAEIFGEVNGTGSPEEHDIARPVAARMVYGLLYTVAHEQYRQLCGSGGEHPEDAARTSVSTNLAKYLQQLGVSGQEAEDVRAAILATLGASQSPATAAA